MLTRCITRHHATVLLLSIAALACKESTNLEDGESDVVAMRLTVGGSTVSIAENGAVTGGPLTISTTAQVLAAAFLRADGSADPKVTEAGFRLDVTGGTGITFTRTGAFAGTLRGAAPGTSSVSVSLFHLGENHDEFGPFPVAVLVQ